MKIISLVLAIGLFLPCLVLAEVYLSAEEATQNIFPTLEKYDIESRIVDNQEFKIFTVFAGDKIIGWSVVLEEMGKIKPITFLVGIDIQGEVLGVRILEYRDMFGSGIKRRSFLRQFQGKSLKDPLRVGRDIDAVTSATISSEAAARAVKKSLEVIQGTKK